MISIYLIYNIKIDDKINIFEISDTKVSKDVYYSILKNKKIDKFIIYYNKYNYRVVDIIRDIEDNIKVEYNNKKYNINNLLVKSNLIVLNIENKYINNINNIDIEQYDYIDKTVKDYEKLLKYIRNESKEDIIILFDYNYNSKYNDYYYNKLKNIIKKYNVTMCDKLDLKKYLKNI